MTFLHENAREWATDHSAAADVRFGRLETMAFQRHPEIYGAFGADGAATASRTQRPAPTAGRRALFWVTVVLAIIGALAPIAAIAVISGDRFDFFRIDAETSVPVASVFYGITVVAQIAVLVFWVVRGARWDGVIAAVVLIAVIFSGFGLVAVPNISAVDGFTQWQPWYPAVVVAFAVSLIATVAVFVRFRVRDEPVDVADEPVEAADPRAVRAAVDRLPATERDAIRADRDDALEILHSRGLVDETTLERALAQELGTLYLLDDTTGGAR
ncbi:hypothetical protein [Microbacterium oleivorans]|uniref:hypothetical protein n=1 Tax=Microbacterium oleivorans TaxID=273677 RepID=UPI00203F1618|nr:hypothetical protein [Microbacterium oleivorans]MCM3697512.1 hypothetical protein [Microbacterium oleivorans]